MIETAHAQTVPFSVAEDTYLSPTDRFILNSGGRLALSHIAGNCRRYPGEEVTFFTKIFALCPVRKFRICITLPAELRLYDYQQKQTDRLYSAHHEYFYLPDIEQKNIAKDSFQWEELLGISKQNRPLQTIERTQLNESNELLLWSSDSILMPGDWYEFSLTATVQSNVNERIETSLESHAFVLEPIRSMDNGVTEASPISYQETKNGDSQAAIRLNEEEVPIRELSKDFPLPFQHETAVITVFSTSTYLQYLPSLYEQDQFMNRFLMVFESLWQPREAVIDQIHTYFDHTVTSLPFLQWMASWFDFSSEMFTDEANLRKLLPQLLILYQQRGTRNGLQKLLTLVTGVPITIEDRVNQLQLNPDIRFGMAFKVYENIEPAYHFYVHVESNQLTALEAQQLENKLHRLLEAEKPAHTTYTIDFAGKRYPSGVAPV